MTDADWEAVTKVPAQVDFRSRYKHYTDHQRVVPASDFTDAMVEYATRDTLGGMSPRSLGWGALGTKVGIRDGELSIWAGVNGHGKSLLLGQVAIELMKQGDRAVIASLEMLPAVTLGRMCRQAVGVVGPSERYAKRFAEWTNGRLWLYDHQGPSNSEAILGMILYCSETLGVKQIFLDSMMFCGVRQDDLDRQQWLVTTLKQICRETTCHVHLVAHSRKLQTEGQPTGKFDIKGSGAITDAADNVFIVWRNKAKKAEEDPDCLLKCEKQRNGDWEGAFPLWHHESGAFSAVRGRKKGVLEEELDDYPD